MKFLFLGNSKRPHTTGETIVLPATVKIIEIIQAKQYGNKVQHTPLSVNTVGRCIGDTAEDLRKQVLEQITQCGRFPIQLDESTDVSSMFQLMVFARFCFNNEICEDVFFMSR